MDNITAYTIVLSFIGIIISVASLIFAIIYFIKITKLQNIQETLIKKTDLLDNIKYAIFPLCALYPEKGKMIPGEVVIKTICNYFKCDEWKAIEFFNLKDPCLNLIDWNKLFIKEDK